MSHFFRDDLWLDRLVGMAIAGWLFWVLVKHWRDEQRDMPFGKPPVGRYLSDHVREQYDDWLNTLIAGLRRDTPLGDRLSKMSEAVITPGCLVGYFIVWPAILLVMLLMALQWLGTP